MVLPYAMWTQVRIRCPHCKREEIRSRALIFVGAEHTCPSCGRRYVVRESFPLVSPRGRLTIVATLAVAETVFPATRKNPR